MTSQEARESILSIQVNAALASHDLGPFAPVESVTGELVLGCLLSFAF